MLIEWTAKDVLRFLGWGLVYTAVLLFFPIVGFGGNESHEPGSDPARQLSMTEQVYPWLVAIAGLGVILIGISQLFPEED